MQQKIWPPQPSRLHHNMQNQKEIILYSTCLKWFIVTRFQIWLFSTLIVHCCTDCTPYRVTHTFESLDSIDCTVNIYADYNESQRVNSVNNLFNINYLGLYKYSCWGHADDGWEDRSMWWFLQVNQSLWFLQVNQSLWFLQVNQSLCFLQVNQSLCFLQVNQNMGGLSGRGGGLNWKNVFPPLA